MQSAYASASQRTWTDAETLSTAGRLGTPDHLYGLAAESALKAILHAQGVISPAPQHPGRRFGVHIDALWEEYVAYMQGQGGQLLVPLPCPFSGWKVSDRYAHDSLFTQGRLAGHRAAAQLAMNVLEDAILAGLVT